jgi:recombination protein RecT
MVAVQRNPDLLAKADRRSLLLSLQRAAQDGLMPDGREGAIVLFGNQATWMPMVAGLMKLARNSGEIASISAHVAYKGEKFRVVLGDEERIEHERDLDMADGEIVAAYAVATLKNGEKIREVMTRAQIEKVRNVSRAKNNGPWVQWYDQMAIKSAIRRLSKRLPLSTDRDDDERFQRAAEREDERSAIDGVAHDVTSTALEMDGFEVASAGAMIEGPVDDERTIDGSEEQPEPRPADEMIAEFLAIETLLDVQALEQNTAVKAQARKFPKEEQQRLFDAIEAHKATLRQREAA